jgi:hypothetical protein
MAGKRKKNEKGLRKSRRKNSVGKKLKDQVN